MFPRVLSFLTLLLVACGEELPPSGTDAGRTDAGVTRRDGGTSDGGLGGGAAGGGSGGGAAGGGIPGPNVPPIVGAAIVAPMTSGWAGQLFSLGISASDANQDRLTFTWSQVSPAGE